MEHNRLSFAVDADDVTLEDICNKDFLVLQMKAISTANPNCNGSWFTRESLAKSVDTCRNKPIMGYFNSEGDFESHNGTWMKDLETGQVYWDTTNGEQMLGLIRESDDVKVVDGDDGLSWLCLSCALWTQYNYKQVKRLFKDAKAAKAKGGVTKNISVEVDILKGEKLENGVYRIDEFKLLGITILGSKKGKKIQPGIANAALSLPDVAGASMYAQQANALRAAYARLDGDNVDTGEKETQNMEKEKTNVNVTPTEQSTASTAEPNGSLNTTTAATMTAFEGNTTQTEGGQTTEQPGATDAGTTNAGATDTGTNTGEHTEGESTTTEGTPDPAVQQNSADDASSNIVYDLAYLIKEINYNYNSLKNSIGYYRYMAEHEPDGAGMYAYVASVLERCFKYETLIEGTLGGLLAKAAGEITEADVQYEAKLAKFAEPESVIAETESEINDLKTKYEAVVAEKDALSVEKENLAKETDTLKTTVAKYEHADFVKSVSTLIDSADISEADKKQIFAACEDGTITSYDDAKVKVALAAFDANHNDNTSQSSVSIESPLANPNVTAAFSGSAEKSAKATSVWDRMEEIANR